MDTQNVMVRLPRIGRGGIMSSSVDGCEPVGAITAYDGDKGVFRAIVVGVAQVLFQDYIKYEGRKEIIKELQHSINLKKESQDTVSNSIKKINGEMKAYEDKDRIEKIKAKFFTKMKLSLQGLNVQMGEPNYKDPTSNKVDRSESSKPRALLAYFFSIITLIREYSSTAFVPIVIDSPKQQDPDAKNYPLMLKYILENTKKDEQLILGVVELPEKTDFQRKIIDLGNKKLGLLKEDEFEAGVQFFNQFTNQIG